MYRIFLYFVLIGAPEVFSKHLPNYIIACKRNDPNLNECAKKHAIDTLPKLLKGDKAYKLPSFLPIYVPFVDVQPGGSLSFKLRDLYIHGLNTTKILDINLDLEKRHIYVKTYFDYTITEAQYEMAGKVLSFPIEGSGPAKITSANDTLEYYFDYDLIKKKNGKEYINVNTLKPTLKLVQEKVHYQFDNLFSNNKLLGDNFNNFLNENTHEVDDIAGVANKKVIDAVVLEAFKAILGVVPYNEIFL